MGSLWGPPPDEEANARSFADAVDAFRAAGATPADAAPAAAPAPKEAGGWREQMKRANAIRDQRAAAATEAGAPTAAPSSLGWREQMRVANAARDRRAQGLRKQQEPEPEPEPLPNDAGTNAGLAAFLSRVAPAVAEQLTANLCDAGDFDLRLASPEPAASSGDTVADCQAAAEAAFTAGEWSDAVSHLTTALRIAAADALKMRQLNLELRAVLLSRRAECFLQEERWKDALDDAREALKIDPENAAYRTIEQNAKFGQEEHPLHSLERKAGTDLPNELSEAGPLAGDHEGPSFGSSTSSGPCQFHQHLKPNVHVTVLVPGVGLGVQPGKYGVLSHQNEDGTWRVVYADGRTGDVEEVRLRRTRAGGRQLSDSSMSG